MLSLHAKRKQQEVLKKEAGFSHTVTQDLPITLWLFC